MNLAANQASSAPVSPASPKSEVILGNVADHLSSNCGLSAVMPKGSRFNLWRPILIGFLVLSAAGFLWQLLVPRTIHVAGLSLDRLSSALTLLVSAVGIVTYRFSSKYLNGDPHRGRFLNWLVFSIASAFVLMMSTNLLVLAVAWFLTSLGLHRLLTHYPERIEGIRAARKKFMISRIGDLALGSAIVLVWWKWGTLDLNRLFELTAGSPVTGAMTSLTLLIVLAALTKSAQFPFHSWLPETMESPTPVSALMHAGIINAGGALLLRTSPLIIRVPEALLLLAMVGTITAILGSIAMWAQVKVKRTLAWSTVSQMGFMMVQCGLGAFPVALLHVVSHGCYKAWSFLRSGDVPPPAPVTGRSTTRSLIAGAVGVVVAVPGIALASRTTGFSPLHSPGELALTSILAISIGQIWIALVGQPGMKPAATVFGGLIAATATGGLAIVAFALYQAASAYLLPVTGRIPPPTGSMAWIAASIPVAGLLFLTVGHALLPALSRTPSGKAFRVHALHGFYFGAIADRLVDSVSRSLTREGKVHARKA